jgi:APA family basic amino acid/polyamine antiporter
MTVPASGESGAASDGGLKRVIGFWGGTALIIGITIGAGIFRKPYSLAQNIHDPWIIMGLWAAFGVISICGALALAELASMMPRTGGTYVYLRAAYGDSSAFVFGWVYLLVATPAAVGALATYFGELLCGVLKLDVALVPWIGCVTLVLLTVANLLGAKLGSAIQSLFTAIKIGALLLLMFVSFVVVDGTVANLGVRSGAHFDLNSLGVGVASVIWAYDGWVAVSMIAGEVIAPERLMKRIIVAGMLAITFLYVGANLGYFHAMTLPDMATATDGVPQAIMSKVMGENGAKMIGAFIMCSVFGALNGNVMTKPRVSYAMSRDGLTFGFLGKAHPRWSTPYAAILIQAAVAIALVVGLTLANPDKPGELFDKLTTYFVVVEWFALLFTVGAVMVLRKKQPFAERPFRTPAYPLVPLIFLLGTAAGLGAIVWGEWIAGNRSPVYGLLLSSLGFPVYWVWRKLSQNDPVDLRS